MTGIRGHRVAAWLRRLEIVLLMSAVASLGWVVHEQVTASRDQANWAEELDAQLAAAAAAPGAGARPADSPRTVQKHAPAPRTLGRIEVPRLGLSAMTREGTDAATLRRAVGHVASSALPGQPGNAAFAGHRDTFFSKLRDVKKGDEIIFTTAEGRHHYVVDDLRVVDSADVSVLEPTTRPVLTLVTCYPFNYIGPAPERFVVRAVLSPSTSTLDATRAALTSHH
jgi:sortase A